MLETQEEPSLYFDYVGTLMAHLQLPELWINIFLLGKPRSFYYFSSTAELTEISMSCVTPF